MTGKTKNITTMKVISLAVLMFALIACNTFSKTSAVDGQSNLPSESTNQIEGDSQKNPEQTNAEQIVTSGAGTTEYTTGKYRLTIESPQDGTTLTEPAVTLSGEVSEWTTLSVNDDIQVIENPGKFNVPLVLEEGPNVIEIVASNLTGEEISAVITVIYEK